MRRADNEVHSRWVRLWGRERAMGLRRAFPIYFIHDVLEMQMNTCSVQVSRWYRTERSYLRGIKHTHTLLPGIRYTNISSCGSHPIMSPFKPIFKFLANRRHCRSRGFNGVIWGFRGDKRTQWKAVNTNRQRVIKDTRAPWGCWRLFIF